METVETMQEQVGNVSRDGNPMKKIKRKCWKLKTQMKNEEGK